MAYYEEDEVRRLITNMAQWSGDGASVGASASNWEREVVDGGWRSDFKIPALGIDVPPTKEALKRIGEYLAAPLCVYYLSSLTFEMQAREILSCAKSTYHSRLERGHLAFMEAYREEVERRRPTLHTYASAPPRTHKL